MCPDAGFVDVYYDNTTEEFCKLRGGEIIRDPAWGGYIGCEPPIHFMGDEGDDVRIKNPIEILTSRENQPIVFFGSLFIIIIVAFFLAHLAYKRKRQKRMQNPETKSKN